MTYFFIGLIALGFVGYIGYFITTTLTTKTNADNASGERTELGTKIDNLSTLLKVEDDLEEGIYRFTYKDSSGKIFSEDKKIEEFIKPYVNVLTEKLSVLKDELELKSKDSKVKKDEIAKLKRSIYELNSEKESLEERLESFLEYVSTIHIENTSKLFKNAATLLLNGDIDAALVLLSDDNIGKEEENYILETSKSQSEIRFLKAKILTVKGSITEANENFEKSIQLSQSFQNTWEYANFLQYQNENEKSINYYNMSLTLTSEKTELGDIYNNLANSYSQNNDFHNAESNFRKAIKLRNETKNLSLANKASYAKSLGNYGRLKLQQGNLNEANIVLIKANNILTEFSESGNSTYNYSLVVLRTNLGTLNSQLGKEEKALENFEAALKLTETFTKRNSKVPIDELLVIKLNLALVYQNKGDLIKAKKLIDESLINVIKYADNRPEVYNTKLSSAYVTAASIYEDIGQSGKAEEYYKKGIELKRKLYQDKPDSNFGGLFNSLNNYAAFLDKNGKYKKALHLFNEAETILTTIKSEGNIELDRQKAMVNYNKGTVLNNLNRPNDAIKEFEKVVNRLRKHLSKINPQVTQLYSDANRILIKQKN